MKELQYDLDTLLLPQAEANAEVTNAESLHNVMNQRSHSFEEEGKAATQEYADFSVKDEQKDWMEMIARLEDLAREKEALIDTCARRARVSVF